MCKTTAQPPGQAQPPTFRQHHPYPLHKPELQEHRHVAWGGQEMQKVTDYGARSLLNELSPNDSRTSKPSIYFLQEATEIKKSNSPKSQRMTKLGRPGLRILRNENS